MGDAGAPRVETYDYALFGEVEVRPLGTVRKIVARRTAAAWAHVPHVAQFEEIDVTRVEALRQDLKPEADARGLRLTLLPFIMRACALALKAFPEVDASLADDAEHLVLKKYCHIGFAADTPHGLLVPVVKDVDKKSLLEIAAAVAGLAEKARAGRLALADVEGGCFTVSNLGPLGGTGFIPTINAPELAILGVGRASRKIVDLDGQIASRPMLPLTLVYDHRVIDGILGGRFMAHIRAQLTDASGPVTPRA